MLSVEGGGLGGKESVSPPMSPIFPVTRVQRSQSSGTSIVPAHLAVPSPQLFDRTVNRKLDQSMLAAANQHDRLAGNNPAGQNPQGSLTSHLHQRPAQPRKHSHVVLYCTTLLTVYSIVFLCYDPKKIQIKKNKNRFLFFFI